MITAHNPILFRGDFSLKNLFPKAEEADPRLSQLFTQTPAILHPLLKDLIALKEGNQVFKRLGEAEKEIQGFQDEHQLNQYTYQNIIISQSFSAYNGLNVETITQINQHGIKALPELLYSFSTGDYAQVNIYKYPGNWGVQDKLLPFTPSSVASQKKNQLLTELKSLYNLQTAQGSGLSLLDLKNDLDSLLVNPATGEIVIGPWQAIAPVSAKDFKAIIKKLKTEFKGN